jgi:hypothetical protein
MLLSQNKPTIRAINRPILLATGMTGMGIPRTSYIYFILSWRRPRCYIVTIFTATASLRLGHEPFPCPDFPDIFPKIKQFGVMI